MQVGATKKKDEENMVTFKERFTGRDIKAEIIFLFSDRENEQIHRLWKNASKMRGVGEGLHKILKAMVLFQGIMLIYQMCLIMAGKFSSGVADIFMKECVIFFIAQAIVHLLRVTYINCLDICILMTLLVNPDGKTIIQKTEQGMELTKRLPDGNMARPFHIKMLEDGIRMDDVPVIVMKKEFLFKPVLAAVKNSTFHKEVQE